ncbi:MAG: hypothetical protein QOE92_2589 [Chloroflexota bacterium]|nr:hypothetical protein [Chloroflexota bacterium]
MRHYYELEASGRESGNGDIVDASTTGHDSLASVNFRAFIASQTAKGRRSVTTQNFFSDWDIKVSGTEAAAVYLFWATGHDIDAGSGAALEPDMTTSKGRYRMTLVRRDERWLVSDRQLLEDNVG